MITSSLLHALFKPIKGLGLRDGGGGRISVETSAELCSTLACEASVLRNSALVSRSPNERTLNPELLAAQGSVSVYVVLR